ncbi:ATP synthase F1 subunit delta [Pajaroellobacter abortibovis]|uniref:ATP synthase subunit delta n=1 Tax=Pajaroellobacter abortibovis TaxID=1882918 RepID=A0A1L6MY67_9BACT|nr:ATP synthase F1 subunit delta [Pajaroellobacter abortibovis]APS00449.1 ATP synthase F1 subunit delta [Pajaroellobacter abortibovis]
MLPLAIASRYGKALFELGLKANELARLVEQLENIDLLYRSSPNLQRVLAHPLLSKFARQAILGKIAELVQLHTLTRNAIFYLADRKRLPILSLIVRSLRDLYHEHQGILLAEVTTAVALPEAFYYSIQQKLELITQKHVQLSRMIDASLLGGVVIRIGNTLYDGSLKTKLKCLKQSLLSASSIYPLNEPA